MMGYRNAQHLYISLLYSEELCNALKARPAEIQKEFNLETHEMQWFLDTDPRAFATDPMRPARGLAALLEESAVSSAHLIRNGCSTLDLQNYFSSEDFRSCIRNRGSMVLAYFRYLRKILPEKLQGSQVHHLIELEEKIALVRRHEFARSLKTPYELSPRIALLSPMIGTLDLFNATEFALAKHPVEPRAGTVDSSFSIPPLAQNQSEQIELLLIELPFNRKAPTIEHPPEALFELLKSAEKGQNREGLMEILEKHGAVGDEGTEVLEGLCGEGLLVRNS